MKLSDVRPNVETSGELEEQFFSIEDQGMIFDILRNKMYSNNILAICREISCNARDAHREVGKEDVPVEITLPTTLDPVYKIKDFGPGISPSRMANVFIKYTASTKRSDNLQTGGFGLGAKTPFSYSDSFNIVTCVDGTQYNYACFIDETKVGKLALLSEAPTTEPNGTTIIIPVKNLDFNAFRDYTEQATRHWKVRPVVVGNKIKWSELNPVLTGTNWVISNDQNHYTSHDLKLVVDGIEYPVDLTTLRKYADCKLIDSCRGHLYLYFGVGELSLSANREQALLDKVTQDKIAIRLAEATNDIHKNVEDRIANFSNYWEANLFYRKEINNCFSNISFLGALKWQGLDLYDHNTFNVTCEVFYFTKHSNTYRFSSKPKNNPDELKLRRTRQTNIKFEERSKLVINDLNIKEPTPRHVKKAFEDDPTLVSLQLICPNDKITLQSLIDKHHIDKMGYILLSDLTKATGRTNAKSIANRLLVFKLDSSGQFRLSSYSALEEDTNKTKVLCYLKKDEFYGQKRFTALKDGKTISSDTLYYLSRKIKDTSIYGVDVNVDPTRVAEEFENFIDIDTFIDQQIVKNSKIDFVGLKYALNHRWSVNERFLRNQGSFESRIVKQDSPFIKHLHSMKTIKNMIDDESSSILQCYEQLTSPIDPKAVKDWEKAHPDLSIEKMETELNQKYPLIQYINDHNVYDAASALAEYINLIDSK